MGSLINSGNGQGCSLFQNRMYGPFPSLSSWRKKSPAAGLNGFIVKPSASKSALRVLLIVLFLADSKVRANVCGVDGDGGACSADKVRLVIVGGDCIVTRDTHRV